MDKPVLLLGNGIRNNPALIEHLYGLGVPVMTTWMSIDLIEETHNCFVGRPGIYGMRASNIILQKATALYCFGARLDEQQVNYDYAGFAPNATKHIYDVDYFELIKLPASWQMYRVDLATFRPEQIPYLRGDPAWLAWCKDLYRRFRPELDGAPAKDGYVDPFAFIHALSDASRPDDVLAISSSGGAPNVFLQAFRVKKGQRITNVCTIGAMGADIPMAIGACIASGGRRTICPTGDGGFQQNAQELEVIRRLQLPITFFVFNNNGYGSIRNMQNGRFDGYHVACDPESGFTIPPLSALAEAYGIDYHSLPELSYPDMMTSYLNRKGPVIVEVPIDPAWSQFPRCTNSLVNGAWVHTPMEDMLPRLPEDELKVLMSWSG